MNMRTVTKLGVAASLLSAIGFVGAIGVLTLVFAPRSGAYAPTSSSDAAAWVQAIGSIAAIVGAFVLGNWQARVARETALELERARESNRIKGLAGVYTHLLKLSHSTLRQVQEANPQLFPDQWNGAVSGWLKSAIDAAIQLPPHDLGSPERIFCAVRIQGMAEDVYRLAAASAARGPGFDCPRFTDDAELSNVIDLHLAGIADLQEEHMNLYR